MWLIDLFLVVVRGMLALAFFSWMKNGFSCRGGRRGEPADPCGLKPDRQHKAE